MRSLLIGSWLALVSMPSLAYTADPGVSVTGGEVRGRTMANPGGAVFKGIPYAAPPVGELRWREPAPVKPWKGVRDAGTYGASCVQRISGWNTQEATGNQEDCLYLNIWTAEWPSKSKQPVMVWIHGGGNTGGGAAVDYFDGASLSRMGVVVVTINYRLGVFGFLAHPALTAESEHRSSGNYGILDQLAALRWVHDNIASFGGDPDNVTVFGQSAGSRDTGFLLASPLSKGLIRRVIQESGSPTQELRSLRSAEQEGDRFATSLKAPAGAAGIKFLRSLPAQQLLESATSASDLDLGSPPTDGWLVPVDAGPLFAAGRQNALPLMIGNNAQEQNGPKLPALRKAVADAFGSNTDKALAFYGLASTEEGNNDPLYGTASMQLWADARQRCHSVQQAIWHTNAGNAVYYYQFDRAIPGEAATRHSAEVPFVFGNLLPYGFLSGPANDTDRAISKRLQTYWTNFAKSGDPNGAGLPAWPRFDSRARPYLELTDKGPVVGSGLRRQICDLFMEAFQHSMNK